MHNLLGMFCDSKGGRIDLFQRMLVFRPVENDQRFPQGRCNTCVKRCVPLPVFVAKPDNHDICLANATAGADGIDAGALVIMPELVVLLSQDHNATVVTCIMIGHGAVEADIAG